ncbi:MAG TPA: toxin TcdB middle/N-terminal domain-containing protein, partial [Puia sp.]|nr:toxin TcdB middle/N-terminal domain-containing protein [Puia sp.]
MSRLNQVAVAGYRKSPDGSYVEQKLPPVDFTYSVFEPPVCPEFKTLQSANGTIPGYLGSEQFLPVDLQGDGIPGFLYSNNESTCYFPPEGNGKYSGPVNCSSFPVNKNIQAGEVSLTDLDGNGELELVVSDGVNAGFYQKNNFGGWDNFRSFLHYPNDISDPKLESTDLDANGKTDLLLAGSENLQVYFSEGKNGYKKGKLIPNENEFPLRKEACQQELVTFADFFGDGLSHRIRITNGSVECWPSLGYGHFGKKITIGNAPFFQNDFDNSRVFLADLDGSGATDIIYAYPDRVEVFLNQNGNFFSDPLIIYLPASYSNIDQISFSDILGNGTSCLLFTKIAPSPIHYYYNFVGETLSTVGQKEESIKPYLLVGIDNNMGSIHQIHYCSSTKFALEDKLVGKPWITKLRFPVQVVEQVTVLDEISGSVYVNKYKYHEGYYDSAECLFRGFGYVESWDSENFQAYKKTNINPGFALQRVNEDLFVPPVYTRTWYQTGAFIENNIISRQYSKQYFKGDKNAYDFPDSIFQPEIYCGGDETIRQAYASLYGRVMRKEIYADDDTTSADNPYLVEESNYKVALLRPATDGQYAVFLVSPRESISYH